MNGGKMRTRYVLGVLLFFAVLILYSVFLSTMYFRDGFDYATEVESGRFELLFRPHHLLWNVVGCGFYLLWQVMGYEGRALLPLQILVSLFGAAGAVILYLEVTHITRSVRAGLFAGLFMAFSYAYWAYSIQAYPYVPAIVMLLLAAVLLQRGAEVSTRNTIFLLLSAVCSAWAVFFHQVSALFVIGATVFILASRGSRSARAKNLLWYLGSVMLLVLAAYLIVGVWVRDVQTVSDFLLFITDRAHSPYFSLAAGHGDISIRQLLKAPIGVGNMFVGEILAMEFLLGNTNLAEKITLLSPSGAPQAYRAMPATATTYALFVLTAVIGLALVALFVYGFAVRRRLWNNYRSWILLSVAWILPFAALVTWYVPQARQWWLFVLPPLCVLLALVANDVIGNHTRKPRKELRLLAPLLVASLFSVNFFGSILISHNPANNMDLVLTELVDPYVQQGDMVITLDRGKYKNALPYLHYFNHVDVLSMRAVFVPGVGDQNWTYYQDIVPARLEDGHEVYVIGDVFHSEIGHRLIAAYSPFTEAEVSERIRKFFADYDVELVLTYQGEPLLYRVQQRSG